MYATKVCVGSWDSENAEHCNDDASQLPRQQHIKQSILNLVHF